MLIVKFKELDPIEDKRSYTNPENGQVREWYTQAARIEDTIEGFTIHSFEATVDDPREAYDPNIDYTVPISAFTIDNRKLTMSRYFKFTPANKGK